MINLAEVKVMTPEGLMSIEEAMENMEKATVEHVSPVEDFDERVEHARVMCLPLSEAEAFDKFIAALERVANGEAIKTSLMGDAVVFEIGDNGIIVNDDMTLAESLKLVEDAFAVSEPTVWTMVKAKAFNN